MNDTDADPLEFVVAFNVLTSDGPVAVSSYTRKFRVAFATVFPELLVAVAYNVTGEVPVCIMGEAFMAMAETGGSTVMTCTSLVIEMTRKPLYRFKDCGQKG